MSTDDMGYALTINRRQPLKLKLFVSHCWNADFADFVKTVRNSVPNNKVIWVCSLCICQNASIEDAIGQTIDSSPFAVALKAARQMLLVVDTLRDGVVETLTRAWCVCEGSLAVKFDTPLMIRGPDMYMSKHFFQEMMRIAKTLDVRQCNASNANDLTMILDMIEQSDGGFDAINANVRHAIEWTIHDILVILRDNVNTPAPPEAL